MIPIRIAGSLDTGSAPPNPQRTATFANCRGCPHNHALFAVGKNLKGRPLAMAPLLALAALLALGMLPASASAVTVPEGFEVRRLPIKRGFEANPEGHLKGLVKPTTIDFGPGGKMFVAEWFGRVKVFDSVEDT